MLAPKTQEVMQATKTSVETLLWILRLIGHQNLRMPRPENESHHLRILGMGVPQQRHPGFTRAKNTDKYLKHDLKLGLSILYTEMSNLKSYRKY